MDPIQDSGHTREPLGAEPHQPIRFAGTMLGEYRHICAFFHSPDEGYRVLLPFIKEGFERGEKASHIVNPRLRDEHLRRLGSVGIDVTEAGRGGQFELHNWEETYFHEGRFDQDKMLALVQAGLEEPKQRGFTLSRVVCNMEWALEDRPGVNDLLEYETRFNYISSHHSDPVICTYDLTRFRADIVIDVMRTHPMAITGGILQENPFFVSPDEFLRELRDRGASRKVAHT